jgi:hypothetical protein
MKEGRRRDEAGMEGRRGKEEGCSREGGGKELERGGGKERLRGGM